MFDALEGHDTAAPSVADPTLPTSTHPLVQEDILDILSAADNASCPCSSRLLNSHSTGHLSVNSDGSFMHVEGLASADDLPCHEEPETTQELATPVDLPEPAALTAFAQDASSVLDRVSEDMSGHATEASITHTNKESGASFLDIITCHWSLVIADSVAIVQVWKCCPVAVSVWHGSRLHSIAVVLPAEYCVTDEQQWKLMHN